MKIEYPGREAKKEEQTMLIFEEYFNDFYMCCYLHGESYYLKKKWYSLKTKIDKIFFYSNSITITLTEENFKELKERLQKFEDHTKIKVNVEVK